ncbi:MULTISPECIES: aspartyl-phosphate phosphatase Spo0E family protein [Pelosinus]|jgi:hypothetical protein|uniref:Sporulation stage 0, Spo0E-like regulatory phosphatase n=1 Tax=Pelosinus fermentans B4 TaxID=1149862 RepID=I9LD35_9FIRM|nr:MULTISPECIES: aspartyl-phosphate phosphatase Spo0E family protein [Pelosinus]MDF2572022.1 Sporulation stage 0, Spo0E-like regulatory phosphatase [Sporomusa sp.]EIW18324.1 Sporulation stage 0, Spo0E-like regulatory phosphatase [Pelosinus fermentans B4]EIW24310.1 Sporulation stage 0, Spo0E-like regulatory phosphatase [Pelosinus fermentans A11]OAM94244.1 Sporulation stage 0, Spo0E-like regulatory phosphatase [Pelosinus fermentans DSM 17108]SDR04014.1 Spo0E like sporulation regulatory protein [
MSDLKRLEEMIEQLRTELHGVSMGRLLTDPQVIKASEKLDALLVEYQKLLRDKGRK